MLAILAVSAALGATAIGWNGVFLSEVARLAPAGEAGRATGGCLFFTYVGVVILPFLFGWLQRASGSYALCFVVAAAVCAAVAVLLVFTGRRGRATLTRLRSACRDCIPADACDHPCMRHSRSDHPAGTHRWRCHDGRPRTVSAWRCRRAVSMKHCVKLDAGEHIRYRYRANGDVDFNIHYHRGSEVHYPVKTTASRSADATFTAPHADTYCLMWERKGEGAVRVDGAVEHAR